MFRFLAAMVILTVAGEANAVERYACANDYGRTNIFTYTILENKLFIDKEKGAALPFNILINTESALIVTLPLVAEGLVGLQSISLDKKDHTFTEALVTSHDAKEAFSLQHGHCTRIE